MPVECRGGLRDINFVAWVCPMRRNSYFVVADSSLFLRSIQELLVPIYKSLFPRRMTFVWESYSSFTTKYAKLVKRWRQTKDIWKQALWKLLVSWKSCSKVCSMALDQFSLAKSEAQHLEANGQCKKKWLAFSNSKSQKAHLKGLEMQNLNNWSRVKMWFWMLAMKRHPPWVSMPYTDRGKMTNLI